MIILKTPEEIEVMREAGRLVARVLAALREAARPGVATSELDVLAERLIRDAGAVPAFKGYRGYPATVCVSINEQVVHGIPAARRLQDGDLVSLDVGAVIKGYYGDAAVSFVAGGRPTRLQADLLDAGQSALTVGVEQAREGNRLSDIGSAIQRHAESRGYSVVRDYAGHGIGQAMHEDPQVPNYGTRGQGPLLRSGMVLAIEPMVNAGTFEVTCLEDGWTVVTRDGRPSVHFEHTVAVTEDGPDILTLP
ncbi:MAG: type I methionyl aminopeptidase [Bacillota bacterium]|nr:MAG: type I methionyl aminopeptidase [Bacillota bacterium]